MAKAVQTKTLILGGFLLAGAGLIGYAVWKNYKASQGDGMRGLGQFTDGGYADYNARVAMKYWGRMNQLQQERMHLQAMRGV